MSRRDAERLARLLEEGTSPRREPEDPGPGSSAPAFSDEGAPAEQEGRAHEAGDAGEELVRLASLAQTLESSAAQPSPRFKAALRERVLATAAEEAPEPAWRARLGGVLSDTLAAWRYSGRTAVASGTMTLLLLLAGLFVGASLSLPGDPLYAIKDAYQQAQLTRASAPADVAAVQLRLASSRIDEAELAAGRNRMDSLAASATDAERLTRDAAETLLAVYRDTGDPAVVAPLSEFVAGQRPRVLELQDRVADADAARALANLVITLDRIDSRTETVLSDCCPPETQASAFWRISAPGEPFDECPCPLEPEDAELDEPLEVPDAERELHDRRDEWRDEFRDGVDDTREGIREGVRDTVDDVHDGVDDTTDDVHDGVDDTTDDVRDTVDDTTDGVRDTTDDVEDTVDDTTDDVEDETDGVRDAVEGTLDGLINGERDDDEEEDEDDEDGVIDDALDGLRDDEDGVLP